MAHKAFRKTRRNHRNKLYKKAEQLLRLRKKYIRLAKEEQDKPAKKFSQKKLDESLEKAGELHRQIEKKFGITPQ